MQNRHKLSLRAADKTGKSDFINIMNAELIQGRIKLHDIHGRFLREEMEALIWDEKGEKRQEHAACENHLCDAALYVWRHCYQYYSEEYRAPAKPYTAAWFKEEEERMEEAMVEKLRREAEFLVDDFGLFA